MCQSRAQGGKRCRAHNCAAEHSRAKRELKQSKKHYDNLGVAYAEKLAAGTVTDADRAEIAAARADVDEKRLIEQFSNPKTAAWFKQGIITALPDEYRTPVSDIGDSIIDHEERAAKAAGSARTARMFDRTEEAEAFDAEADDERSKAARLVSGLRAAFYDARTAISEHLKDAAESNNGDVDTPQGFLADLLSVFGETLEAGLDVIGETAEGVASGVGVEPTMADTEVHERDAKADKEAADQDEPAEIEDISPDDDQDDNDDEFVGEAAAPGAEGHERRRSDAFDDKTTPKPKATAGTALRKSKPKVTADQRTTNTEPTVNQNSASTESANTETSAVPKTNAEPVRDHQPATTPTPAVTVQPLSYNDPVRNQTAAAPSTKSADHHPQPSGTGTRTSTPNAAPIPQTAPTASQTHTPTADPFTDVTSLSDDDLLKFIADAYSART